MSRAKAAASSPDAALAAEQMFSAGGGAIDAALAGFFVAAATNPTVLLAPLVGVVTGVGMAGRFIDGRALQPGRRLRRPRGFTDDDAIPQAAYVAVSRSLPALALIHAYGARRTIAQLARGAISIAKKAGATKRAEALDLVVRHGAAALRTTELSRIVLAAAGTTAGGLLSAADLADAVADDEQLAFDTHEGVDIATPSWRAAATMRPCGAVVAADGHGTLAAIAWEQTAGFEIAELELSLPQFASAVRRGVPRVTPGTPIASSAELAVLKLGSSQIVVAMSGKKPLELQRIAGKTSLTELAAGLSGPTGIAYLATVEKGRGCVAHGPTS